MQRSWLSSALFATALFFSATGQAEEYVISLKGNQFSPKELAIPAEQKVRITVKNLDATPAEFESYDLNREKVIGANSEIVLFVGPLKAGSYTYFDDFHRDTTQGTITVK